MHIVLIMLFTFTGVQFKECNEKGYDTKACYEYVKAKGTPEYKFND